MADTPDFAKLVPGFDFLQGLVRNAGTALPNIGKWVAPTLDPAELDKRIEELRTVQFWLEQNARMLAATIQALEVQRMTLSTLKTMNVQMADLQESMRIKLPQDVRPKPPAATPAPAAADTPAASRPAVAPATKPRPKPPRSAPAPATDATPQAAGVVDPMQWWGALTQQFTQLAATAMRDAARAVPGSEAPGDPAPHGGAAAAARKPRGGAAKGTAGKKTTTKRAATKAPAAKAASQPTAKPTSKPTTGPTARKAPAPREG